LLRRQKYLEKEKTPHTIRSGPRKTKKIKKPRPVSPPSVPYNPPSIRNPFYVDAPNGDLLTVSDIDLLSLSNSSSSDGMPDDLYLPSCQFGLLSKQKSV
jgi:hypothetical protein